MEASDVYLKNGRRYLRIGTPPLEYLQRIFPGEHGPEWERCYQEMVDDGVLIRGKPMQSLEDEKYERYIAWRNGERTATTGYVCSMCHEICEGKLGFCKTKKFHKCYHDGIEEKKEEYPCEVCEKLFKSKQNLKNHEKSKGHLLKVQAVQDTNRKYCRICDKTFATTKLLRKHETTCELHKKIASGKFCKHCDKMFAKPDGLRRHMKKYHQELF